jgi:hypothetical protein
MALLSCLQQPTRNRSPIDIFVVVNQINQLSWTGIKTFLTQLIAILFGM